LQLTARRSRSETGSETVTSARLTTHTRFSVGCGRVAARMKVPTGAGLWSAFWMLGEDLGSVGWPACGEIDVVEHVGSDPTATHGTLHGPGYSGIHGGIGRRHDHGTPLGDDFHVYAVDRWPDRISWSLDGTVHTTLTRDSVPGPWPFGQPFHLLLNLAVGGAWPGLETGRFDLPAVLEVDWIRVWERDRPDARVPAAGD
jgi:beta-glucanase (GH16 family)